MNMKHAINDSWFPLISSAYEYLKIEVLTKVAPFLKSAHKW